MGFESDAATVDGHRRRGGKKKPAGVAPGRHYREWLDGYFAKTFLIMSMVFLSVA